MDWITVILILIAAFYLESTDSRMSKLETRIDDLENEISNLSEKLKEDGEEDDDD